MLKRVAFIVIFSSLLFPLQRAWSEELVPLPETAVPPATGGDPLLREARQAMEASQWRKARRTIKKYLDENKKSAEAWTLLAQTYLATGANGKALRRFDKALKFDPHYAPAFVGRGEVFEKKGRLDEAANDFRAALLSDPNNTVAGESLTRVTPPVPATE